MPQKDHKDKLLYVIKTTLQQLTDSIGTKEAHGIDRKPIPNKPMVSVATKEKEQITQNYPKNKILKSCCIEVL